MSESKTVKTELTLHLELLSAATFGRGDGLPGEVNSEVEHDEYGLPYLRGRTLRGLLAEEMESLLYSLQATRGDKWYTARDGLLGVTARALDETGIMHVGDARFPTGLRQLIAYSLETQPNQLSRVAMLEAVTALRRQTAMNELGAPETNSLRTQRVILPGTQFAALLTFDRPPSPHERALLAATVLAWRRAGTGRNRGRGRLRAWVNDEAWMQKEFGFFQQEVGQ